MWGGPVTWGDTRRAPQWSLSLYKGDPRDLGVKTVNSNGIKFKRFQLGGEWADGLAQGGRGWGGGEGKGSHLGPVVRAGLGASLDLELVHPEVVGLIRLTVQAVAEKGRGGRRGGI